MRRALPTALAAMLLSLSPAVAQAAEAPGTPEAGTAATAAASWSVTHDGAHASGSTRTEPNGLFHDLVVEGTLTGSGSGCHSVWTRFVYDLAPGFPVKQAEVCGSESAQVALRAYMMPTTSGYITVCRGTEDTEDCAAWNRL